MTSSKLDYYIIPTATSVITLSLPKDMHKYIAELSDTYNLMHAFKREALKIFKEDNSK